VKPAAWRFDSTSYGKPRVAAGLPKVNFCISHIETMSVIAVSRDMPVGVDIETIAEAPCAKLVAQFCSTRERRRLAQLSGPAQAHAFAKLWELKEAYTKLTGTGLAADFRFLEFGAGPELSTVDCQAHRTRGETRFESWLTEAPGALYQVAVAVGGTEAAAGRGELVCFAVEDGIDISQSRTLNPGGGLLAIS